MRWWLLGLFVFGGCVHADLVACPDGTACPSGTACDVVHGGCVTPEQLTACDGLVTDDDCSVAGLTGGCFDNVCLPRGCGNRVVETAEVCDDGNETSSDGCRSDCRSNETCGNGTVDSGEECDDANLLSRDDCDSRCLRETTRTRIVPWSMATSASSSASDPTSQRLIATGVPDATWIYDGHRWEVVWTPSPSLQVTLYDEDRQAVVAVSAAGASRWNGATWTAIAPPAAPQLSYITAVHDRARHRDLVVTSAPFAATSSDLWELDGSGQWTSLGVFTSEPLQNAVSAVDPQTNEVVIAGSSGGRKQWTYDGVTWTEVPDPIGITRMFVDRDELRGTVGTAMYARRDQVWVAIPAEDLPAPSLAIIRDDHDELIATDGVSSYAFGAQGWTPRPALPLIATRYLFADDTAFRLFDLPQTSSVDPMPAWTIDPEATPDTYPTTTPPGIIGRESALAVRSLGRRGLVLANGAYVVLPCTVLPCPIVRLEDTAVFDGTSWTQLENAVDLTGGIGAYDPAQRRILIDNGGAQFWQLRDEDSTWTPAEPNLDEQKSIMAWDASVGRFVGASNTDLFELTPTGWIESELAPRNPRYLASDERTGGVLAIVDVDETSVLWERRNGSWHKAETLPLLQIVSDAYRSRDGTTMLLARGGRGVIALFRDRTSPTPLETCEASIDADGDGLAYCDDPDCYWRCSRCPPYTTCRFNYEPE